MPIYEYQCQTCGEIRTDLRKISERDDPFIAPCVDRPLHPIEVAAIAAGQCKQSTCEFKFVVSATPTTFRHNDFTGYGGLDKKRKMWDKK